MDVGEVVRGGNGGGGEDGVESGGVAGMRLGFGRRESSMLGPALGIRGAS